MIQLLIDRILAWLEKVLPPFLSGYYLGKGSAEREKRILEAYAMSLKLKLEGLENEKKVRMHNLGKSSLDIVNDALAEGRRIRNDDEDQQ